MAMLRFAAGTINYLVGSHSEWFITRFSQSLLSALTLSLAGDNKGLNFSLLTQALLC